MKVIIVGGVAGGASAAARIRRLDEEAEILVFERSGHVSYANCGLPYYIGGVILPGLKVSLDSLSGKTAQLPYISLDIPGNVIGKNTIDCMRSGIMYGNAAMIDGIIDRMEKELKRPASLVATGGLAKFITPLSRHKISYEDDLLLKGLLILYNKNLPRS